MIVVEDPSSGEFAAPTHLADVSCPGACEHDIQLLFQPVLSYGGGGTGFSNIQETIEDDDLFR